MNYFVRHLTKFTYKSEVSESIMETRMHPRSDQNQRCLMFQLSVTPRCRVFSYRDHHGNHVHHFDIPGPHTQLVIVAESLVETQPVVQVPDSLPSCAWQELDRQVAEGDFWEMLLPSQFATPAPALKELAAGVDLRRKGDPLSVVCALNKQLFDHFDYRPDSTRADSPIDLALRNKAGVCQDFAHVMTTLLRTELRIPCRYVSGYLFHGGGAHDRSEAAATHAWVEAFLPELGWVGFDPTNDLVAGDRHIRTAIGRDYADVPPTHGVFRGRTKSELTVAVHVTQSDARPELDRELPAPEEWSILVEKAQAVPDRTERRQHQQAQQ